VLYAIEKLRGRKDIISAEPDYAFQMTSTNPDDTYFSAGNQWGLNGTNGIRAPQAWSMATGSNTVMVGVIDSGIQADHPDLQGRVNTALSRDFTLPAPHIPATVTDTNGHGTHCAGIIGAQGNNGIGITGVAQNIQLVSLRISQQGGTAAAENTFASHVIMAINFAATENIPILSCSNCTQNFLGSAASLTAFETAVTNYTGLYINAAGNNARDNDANTGGFPRAQFRPNNFLSVGSLDSNGSLSSFSNWGINTVDIYAPGGSILSTWPTALTAQHDSGKPNYRTISGTSMATPHVAGVAALMLSINPNLTPQQLRNNIRDSATIVSLTTPNTSFWPWQNNSITFNGRCLNAETAVGVVATFSTRALSTTTIEIVGTALNRQLIGSIVIPETLDGRTVTQIEASAFSGQTGMSQITIPASITNIGSNAFENCTSLTNVALSNNLTSIGNSAFKGCSSLSSITMPNSVTTVDSSAFENCTSLTNVALPNNLTSIGNSAFKGCTSLTSITIPFVGNSKTATGNDAKFVYIFGTIPNQLRTVIITGGTNLPQDAFYNCSNLTSITIPDSVTSIGSNAFKGCYNLINLTIPNSVTSLGSSVLSGCSSLTSISIPFVGKSRTAIDHYAKFGYLFGSTPYDEGDVIDQNGVNYYIPINLETVEVTSGTNIPQDAFFNYSWLTSITLPNTVTSIGSNAFYNCYSLTNPTMPNALTSIGSNAFYYCLSLTSLTIPDSVTSLGS
jgi:subtilisin family serine protease